MPALSSVLFHLGSMLIMCRLRCHGGLLTTLPPPAPPRPDSATNCKTVREVYALAGDLEGPFTTPLLWDKKENRIVCNESQVHYDYYYYLGGGGDLLRFSPRPHPRPRPLRKRATIIVPQLDVAR